MDVTRTRGGVEVKPDSSQHGGHLRPCLRPRLFQSVLAMSVRVSRAVSFSQLSPLVSLTQLFLLDTPCTSPLCYVVLGSQFFK